MHDDMQAMRVFQMSKCIADGQIPCRWVPDMGYGYGYPQFSYYGPLPYYVMTLVHFLGVNLFTVVNLGFILSLLLGNIAMFLLGSEIWGGVGGILAALAYAYAPYRASDVYSRGAMGESWAFVFLPLVFWFTYRLVKKASPRNIAWLALSFTALVFTHNVTTLIATPFLALFFIVSLLLENPQTSKQLFHKLKAFILSMVLAGLASASFIFGVVLEKKDAHTESMVGGYFDYRAHFVTIYQLFVSTFWGTGSSEIGPHDDLAFFIGPVLLILLLITLLLFVYKRQKSNYKSFVLFASLLLFGLMAAFMTHEKSSLIWKLLPPLIYLQFPWRFLVLVNFFLTLAVGALALFLKDTSRLFTVFVFGFLLFVFNYAFFTPSQWFSYSVAEKFSGPSWDKQMTISIFDYLPIAAKFPPNAPAFYLPQVITGEVGILNFRRGSNWFSFTSNSNQGAEIRLPTYCFPGWKLSIDGQETAFSCATNLGLVQFNVPRGLHEVSLKLHDSLPRLVGDILSLIFLPFTVYLIISKRYHD